MSRTTYANLFSKIGTTYGTGDGFATFNLPNLTDRFIQGNNTAGTVKSAGLPNITGWFGNIGAKSGVHFGLQTVTSYAEGAFYIDASRVSNVNDYNAAALSTGVRDIMFDASLSSSVYSNSTTVQPPALTMRFAIFAGHSALHRWIRTA